MDLKFWDFWSTCQKWVKQVKLSFTKQATSRRNFLKPPPAMRFEFSKKEKNEKNEKNHKISKKLNISENFGFFSKSSKTSKIYK